MKAPEEVVWLYIVCCCLFPFLKVGHKVTSVVGHVFSFLVNFPTEYQSWESVDPAELFHAPVRRKPCKDSIVSHLQNEAKGVDFIVLWMDCDREGENNNFEVLSCCQHLMRGGSQAYFSAINDSDILKAYNLLGMSCWIIVSSFNYNIFRYLATTNTFHISNSWLFFAFLFTQFRSYRLGKPDKNQATAVDARQELDLKVGVGKL